MRAAPLVLISALLLIPIASADLVPDPEADVPAEDGLSGREIYQRVLDHALRSVEFEATLTTGDPHEGDRGTMTFSVRWHDYQGERGISSRTVVRLEAPYSVRYAGFLYEVYAADDRASELFGYISAFRRLVRVPLRAVSLYGTDFDIDDIVPREALHFRYHREPDEVYEGLPVYVVELRPRPGVQATHSRIVLSIDQALAVVLRARYWSAAGVPTKELTIPRGSVRRVGESWIPHEMTMRSLTDGAYAVIRVGAFDPDPQLRERDLALFRLETH